MPVVPPAGLDVRAPLRRQWIAPWVAVGCLCGWVALALSCLALRAAEDLPAPVIPAPEQPVPVPESAPNHPLRPPAGVQEGPYYKATDGAAGVLFLVSRSLEGEPLSRQAADFRFGYARDWHRGDGGLGDWLGVRGILRYRSAGVLLAYDDRRFGPGRAERFQAAHLLFGGVVERKHAQPFDDAGVGLCLWWPHSTGEVRVMPEIGFRSTLARWPVYRASLAAFRRGEAQGNAPFYVSLEVFGSGGWNFKSIQGWMYDGGAQLCVGLGRLQAAAGYQIWGLRKHVAQGPLLTATFYF